MRASVLNGSRKVLRRRVLARKLLGHVRPDDEMVYNHESRVHRAPVAQCQAKFAHITSVKTGQDRYTRSIGGPTANAEFLCRDVHEFRLSEV